MSWFLCAREALVKKKLSNGGVIDGDAAVIQRIADDFELQRARGAATRDRKRWRSTVTCPANAPYADIWATMVQARSLYWRFRCQDNESPFFSCSSTGEWF